MDHVGKGIAGLLRDYRGVASKAIANPRTSRKNIFVPFVVMTEGEFCDLVLNPSAYDLTSNRNDGTEPAYATPKEALGGRNLDGSIHPAFGILNVDDLDSPELVGYTTRNGSLKIVDPRKRKSSPEYLTRGISPEFRVMDNLEADLDLSY